MSYTQVDNLVIMTTSIIATVLLMHRRGISQDLLVERVVFIYDEILARKGIVQINIKPNAKIIKIASNTYQTLLNKREIFMNLLSLPKTGEKSLLMLSYYQKQSSSSFINEAEISASTGTSKQIRLGNRIRFC
jgi:hypothetical protein